MDGVAEGGSEERLKGRGYMYTYRQSTLLNSGSEHVVKHLYCTKASYQTKQKTRIKTFFPNFATWTHVITSYLRPSST